jgi:hypothetical protein
MGDRANIGFKQESGDILWVYAHWNFRPGQAAAVAAALEAARGRWDDPSYGNRLALGYLLENGASGVTVNSRDDNEHSMYLVDWDEGEVHLLPEYDGGTDHPDPIVSWGFQKFIDKYSKVEV